MASSRQQHEQAPQRVKRRDTVDRFNAVLASLIAAFPADQRDQIVQIADNLINNPRMSASCIEQVTQLLTLLT